MSTSTLPPAGSATVSHPSRAWSGPRGHWLWGCLRKIQFEPLEFYDHVFQTYGEYARVRILPGVPMYFLAAPEAIEHVLVKAAKNYRKPDMFNRSIGTLTGQGLVGSEGELWLRQRRLAQPAFLRNQVARFGPIMTAGVERMLGRWEVHPADEPLNLAPELMRLTLGIISTALFSQDMSDEATEFGAALAIAFEHASLKLNGRLTAPGWLPTPHNRRVARSRLTLRRMVQEIIDSRRHSPHEPRPTSDMLDRFMAARDEQSGHGMSDELLRDEIITMLTAGHDTVAAALSWAWHLLGQNPAVQHALADEARGVLGGRLPTVADLPSLPLAGAVFDEAMRLYPPAWGQPREAIAEDNVFGYVIPPKQTVIVSQWVAHRHPAYWTEPLRFRPERFLSADQEARPKFAYFPFGGGPRVCIGKEFALLEGPLVLAAMAQAYEFTPDPTHPVVPDTTFTLKPKDGVRMFLRRR